MAMGERRRGARAPLNVALLLSRDSGQPLRGECENLAIGGLALRCEVALRVGEPLHLTLPLPGEAEPLDLVGHVSYVVELTHPPGSFRAGLEFHQLSAAARRAIEACVARRLDELTPPTGS